MATTFSLDVSENTGWGSYTSVKSIAMGNQTAPAVDPDTGIELALLPKENTDFTGDDNLFDMANAAIGGGTLTITAIGNAYATHYAITKNAITAPCMSEIKYTVTNNSGNKNNLVGFTSNPHGGPFNMAADIGGSVKLQDLQNTKTTRVFSPWGNSYTKGADLTDMGDSTQYTIRCYRTGLNVGYATVEGGGFTTETSFAQWNDEDTSNANQYLACDVYRNTDVVDLDDYFAYEFVDNASPVIEFDPIDAGTTFAWDKSTFNPIDSIRSSESALVEYQLGVSADGVNIIWDAVWQTAAVKAAAAGTVHGRYIHIKARIVSDGVTISSIWDSPAVIQGEKATATRIHRSVGTEAGDLNTTPRTVEIAGTLAVFSGAMPDNVGIGDALEYDDGSVRLAFINHRYTDTIYGVEDKDGGTPVAAGPLQAVSVFRAYLKLDDWEDIDESVSINAAVRNFDTTRNIVVANLQIEVACYADGLDNNSVNVQGAVWKCNAINYIHIFTPYKPSQVGVTQRHLGKWGIATEAYTIEGDAGSALVSDANNLYIEGLQLLISAEGSNFDYGYQSQAVDGIVERCIAKDVGSGNARIGFRMLQRGLCKDCIAYDFDNSTGVGFYGKDGLGSDAAVFCNDTARNCITGFDVGTAGEMRVLNCLAQDCGNGFDGVFHTDSDYNCSDQAGDPPGAHSVVGEVAFVDEDNEDFHLDESDTVARDAGKDLSNDPYCGFSICALDIDSEYRNSELWDIGADEFIAEGEAAGGVLQINKLVFE